MAITTLDGALAGMKPPHTFAKAPTGTIVAGRPGATAPVGVCRRKETQRSCAQARGGSGIDVRIP